MTEQFTAALVILRLKQVEKRTGLKRSTIYGRMASNTFPRAIKLGGSRAVGWLEHEINRWLESQIKISRKKD